MDTIAHMCIGSKWCYMSKRKMSDYLDLPRSTIFRNIKTLKSKGLLIQNKTDNRKLAPSKIWTEILYNQKTKAIAMANDSATFISYIQDGVMPTPKPLKKTDTKELETKVSQNGPGGSISDPHLIHNSNKIKSILESSSRENLEKEKKAYREKMGLPDDFELPND